MKPTECPHCGSLTYDYAGLVIEDLVNGRVRCGDKVVILPTKEVLLLQCLLEARGRLVPKSSVYLSMYRVESRSAPDEYVIESHASKLRKRLREIGAPVTIVCIREAGYGLKTENEKRGRILEGA